MVGNLPANARNMGLGPGPGGSLMPWSGWARAPQLLGLRSGARQPQLLRPTRLTAEPVSAEGEAIAVGSPRHGEEWPPLARTGESPHTETKTQHSQK